MSLPPNSGLLVVGPSVLQNRLDVASDASFNKNVDISGNLRFGLTGGSKQIYLNGVSIGPVGLTGPVGPAGPGGSGAAPLTVILHTAIPGNQIVNATNNLYGKFFNTSTGSLTGFSFSTGVFTAPSDGLYLFTLTLFINSASPTQPNGRTLGEIANDVNSYLMFNNAYNSNGDAGATINTCHYLLTGRTHYYYLGHGSITCFFYIGHTQLKITKLL